MTTVKPVNPRATVEAVFVADFDYDSPVPAGHWHFSGIYGEPDDAPPAGFLFGCPCGCGELKSASIRGERRPLWQWDGNREKPTLTPSLNILQFDENGNQVGEHWHGWLRDGVFVSC